MTAMRSAVGVCREPHQRCRDCGYGRHIDETAPLNRHDCPNPDGVLGWTLGATVNTRDVQANIIRIHPNRFLGPTVDLQYGPGWQMLGVPASEITPAVCTEGGRRVDAA